MEPIQKLSAHSEVVQIEGMMAGGPTGGTAVVTLPGGKEATVVVAPRPKFYGPCVQLETVGALRKALGAPVGNIGLWVRAIKNKDAQCTYITKRHIREILKGLDGAEPLMFQANLHTVTEHGEANGYKSSLYIGGEK